LVFASKPYAAGYPTQYILVFSKQTFSRANPFQRKPTISRNEFLEFTKSVWHFPAEPATKVGIPPHFLSNYPTSLIQLYTFEGEVVLDPFIGVGQRLSLP
jgi:DNA modification methylase